MNYRWSLTGRAAGANGVNGQPGAVDCISRKKKNPRPNSRGLATREEVYMRPQARQADPPAKFAAMSETGATIRPSEGLESQLLPSMPQGL